MTEDPHIPDLVTTGEAAHIMGLSKQGVAARIEAGTLPARRVGRYTLIRRAVAEAAAAPGTEAAHEPLRRARVRLEGERADVEALTQALYEGRAHVEHLEEPAPGHRSGYLAYGHLTTRPEGSDPHA